MKKTMVVVFAVAILVAAALAFYWPRGRSPEGPVPALPASATSAPAAPPASPWKKALNVSAGDDFGSIAGAIEEAFDENQMRRRLVLGFWAQGYRADQIAVMTGYRVKTVLEVLRNYEKDVKQEAEDIQRLVYQDDGIAQGLPSLAEQIRANLEKQSAPSNLPEETD